MSSSASIEQQHQEFKRQISAHDTYPCFLLDQTFQQRFASPNSNVMPSFLSTQALSPLTRSPMPTTNQSRLSGKPSNQYRLFPSSPLSNPTTSNTTTSRTHSTNTRSTTQMVDVPIEKTIVPLRTLTDLFPSFSYSTMKIPYKKSGRLSEPVRDQVSSSTTGVSIFGFREEDLQALLQQFEDIGPTMRVEQPAGCEHGNFLHIIYSNNVSCQNALSRDGMMFNGHMIGVVPLITN